MLIKSDSFTFDVLNLNVLNFSLMKKFIIALLMTITGIFYCYPQLYFHVGYNGSFPTKYQNLNFVIDRYNETRPYLDKQLHQITYLDGFTMAVGFVANVVLDIGYTGGKQSTIAEADDGFGGISRRELVVKTSLFDVDLGFGAAKKEGAFFAGFSANIGSMKVKTRVGEKKQIKDRDWKQINYFDDMVFNLGVFARILFDDPGFFIQPYFLFAPFELFESNMYDVNFYLNPDTYEHDPNPLIIQHTMFGIKLGFALAAPED